MVKQLQTTNTKFIEKTVKFVKVLKQKKNKINKKFFKNYENLRKASGKIDENL